MIGEAPSTCTALRWLSMRLTALSIEPAHTKSMRSTAAIGSGAQNQGAPEGATYGAPVNDADTQLMGTSDYDGDGRADLFWRNTRTGANTIWLGGRSGFRQAMPRVADAAWDVQP